MVGEWGVKPLVDPSQPCGACSGCIRWENARLMLARAEGHGEVVSALQGPDCRKVRDYRRAKLDAVNRAALEATRTRTA